MIGKALGHNRIVEKIGEGGMGAVYRAHDEHLARDVAVKVLPEGALDDESARKRFRSEAQALSKLNHPNIASVYDFDTQDGMDFLVMEYIHGETLRQKLERGPLSEKEIAELGQQLAEGLGVAHEQGIVHCDLKPGNLLVTPEGRLKILDFGLAKLARPSVQTDSTDSSTLSRAAPGTIPYAAPEQLLGQKVDSRSDIYSAGMVLYEMATGQRAFCEKTVAALVSDTLYKKPVPPGRLRPDLPIRLEEIILKCLEKDPADRYQSAKELSVDLRRSGRLEESGDFPTGRGRRLWPLWALVAVLGTGAGLVVFRSAIETARRSTLPEYNPRTVITTTAWKGQPAISPDGSEVAYAADESGNLDIYVVNVNGGNPRRLTSSPASDTDPAWFPDGTALAFTSDRGGSWGIWKVGREGGGETPLLPNARHPAVSGDGRIAFSRTEPNGVDRIGVAPLSDLSNPRILTGDHDEPWSHLDPAWSPDGKSICYGTRHDLWIVSATGGPARRLTNEGEFDFDPAWSAKGPYVYFSSMRDGTLALWRVDSRGGLPERLTRAAGPECHPSITRDGTRLVYSTGVSEQELILLDCAVGKEMALSNRRNDYMGSIAPDASKVVFVSERSGAKHELYVQQIVGGKPSGEATRLTEQPGNASHPVFSPDGRWIAYYRIAGKERDIWFIPSEGGVPIRFTGLPGGSFHPAWSPKGDTLAFVSLAQGAARIWLAPVKDGKQAGSPRPLTDGSVPAFAPAWSPDGSELAFQGTKADQVEIWVVPVGGSAKPRQVTTGAQARRARWHSSGKTLYVSGLWGSEQLTLRLVPLEGGTPRPADPPVVFGSRNADGLFDLSRDGRLLIYSREDQRGDICMFEAKKGIF